MCDCTAGTKRRGRESRDLILLIHCIWPDYLPRIIYINPFEILQLYNWKLIKLLDKEPLL